MAGVQPWFLVQLSKSGTCGARGQTHQEGSHEDLDQAEHSKFPLTRDSCVLWGLGIDQGSC